MIAHHPDALALHHQMAQRDLERRDRKGELFRRGQANRCLRQARADHTGAGTRVLAGTGDFLIWLGQKLKNRNRVESPVAV